MDKDKIKSILNNVLDLYGDFYITKSNLRLFLKENQDLLFEAIEKGDRCIYSNNTILFITGFSDNWDRKYIKVLYNDLSEVEKLLKGLEPIKMSLYAKIKRINPLKEVLEKNGFECYKNRGKEILMRKINEENK